MHLSLEPRQALRGPTGGLRGAKQGRPQKNCQLFPKELPPSQQPRAEPIAQALGPPLQDFLSPSWAPQTCPPPPQPPNPGDCCSCPHHIPFLSHHPRPSSSHSHLSQAQGTTTPWLAGAPPRPWQSSSSPREPALLLALAHPAARPLRSATLTSPRCLTLAAVSAALVSPWLSPRIIQASGQHHLLRGVPSSRWATFLPGTATLRSYFTYMFTPIICFSHQNGSPLKAGFCLAHCHLPSVSKPTQQRFSRYLQTDCVRN